MNTILSLSLVLLFATTVFATPYSNHASADLPEESENNETESFFGLGKIVKILKNIHKAITDNGEKLDTSQESLDRIEEKIDGLIPIEPEPQPITVILDREVYQINSLMRIHGMVNIDTSDNLVNVEITDKNNEVLFSHPTILRADKTFEAGLFIMPWNFDTSETYTLTISNSDTSVQKNFDVADKGPSVSLQVEKPIYHMDDRLKILGNILGYTSNSEFKVEILDSYDILLFSDYLSFPNDQRFVSGVQLTSPPFKENEIYTMMVTDSQQKVHVMDTFHILPKSSIKFTHTTPLTYVTGGIIKINGSVDLISNNTAIQTEIVDPNGNTVKDLQITIDDDKSFLTFVTLDDSEFDILGYYTIKSSYGNDIAERIFFFIPIDLSELDFSIRTGKPSYQTYDNLSFIVESSEFLGHERLGLEYIRPNGDVIDGYSIHVNRNGITSDGMWLEESDGFDKSGTYAIVLKKQDKKVAETTFEFTYIDLSSISIVFETDKQVYEMGETVGFSGSVGNVLGEESEINFELHFPNGDVGYLEDGVLQKDNTFESWIDPEKLAEVGNYTIESHYAQSIGNTTFEIIEPN